MISLHLVLVYTKRIDYNVGQKCIFGYKYSSGMYWILEKIRGHSINFSSIIAVMSDGLPSPNGTCDALFPGRTGHPKGTLESPGKKSHLFQRLEGPLQCTKSLVPSDSQSLTLTVGFIYTRHHFLDTYLGLFYRSIQLIVMHLPVRIHSG